MLSSLCVFEQNEEGTGAVSQIIFIADITEYIFITFGKYGFSSELIFDSL